MNLISQINKKYRAKIENYFNIQKATEKSNPLYIFDFEKYNINFVDKFEYKSNIVVSDADNYNLDSYVPNPIVAPNINIDNEYNPNPISDTKSNSDSEYKPNIIPDTKSNSDSEYKPDNIQDLISNSDSGYTPISIPDSKSNSEYSSPNITLDISQPEFNPNVIGDTNIPSPYINSEPIIDSPDLAVFNPTIIGDTNIPELFTVPIQVNPDIHPEPYIQPVVTDLNQDHINYQVKKIVDSTGNSEYSKPIINDSVNNDSVPYESSGIVDTTSIPIGYVNPEIKDSVNPIDYVNPNISDSVNPIGYVEPNIKDVNKIPKDYVEPSLTSRIINYTLVNTGAGIPFTYVPEVVIDTMVDHFASFYRYINDPINDTVSNDEYVEPVINDITTIPEKYTVPLFPTPTGETYTFAENPVYQQDLIFTNAIQKSLYSDNYIKSKTENRQYSRSNESSNGILGQTLDFVGDGAFISPFRTFLIQDQKKVAIYLAKLTALSTLSPYGQLPGSLTLAEATSLEQDFVHLDANTINPSATRDEFYNYGERSDTYNLIEARNKIEADIIKARFADTPNNVFLGENVHNYNMQGHVGAHDLGKANVVFSKPIGKEFANAFNINKIIHNVLNKNIGSDPITKTENLDLFSRMGQLNSYNVGGGDISTARAEIIRTIVHSQATDKTVNDYEYSFTEGYSTSSVKTPDGKPFKDYLINSIKTKSLNELGSSLSENTLDYDDFYGIIGVGSQNDTKDGLITDMSLSDYNKIINNFTSGKSGLGNTKAKISQIPFAIELFGNSSTKRAVLMYPHIDSLNESYFPQWEQYSFYGRSEYIYNYQLTTRTLNLSFWLYVPQSDESSIKKFKKKIEYLAQMCYPKFDGSSIRKRLPPLLRITVGDVFVRQPGFFNDLNIDWLNSSQIWDTRIGSRIPRMVQISTSITFIHEEIPNLESLFYGAGAQSISKGISS